MGRAPALTFRPFPRPLPMTVVLSAPPVRLRTAQLPTGTPPDQRKPHSPSLVPFPPRLSWRASVLPSPRHLPWLLHFRKAPSTKTWNLPPPLSYHRQAQLLSLPLLLLRWRKPCPPAPWSPPALRALHRRSSLHLPHQAQIHLQRRCNLLNRLQKDGQSPKAPVQRRNSKEGGQTTSTCAYSRCERFFLPGPASL